MKLYVQFLLHFHHFTDVAPFWCLINDLDMYILINDFSIQKNNKRTTGQPYFIIEQ